MSLGTFLRDHLTIILAIAIFIAIIIAGWKYVFVAILALTIAVILIPLHKRMTKHIPAPLSAGILTCGVYGLILGIAAGVIFTLLNNYETLFAMIYKIIEWIGSIFGFSISAESGASFFSDIANALLDALISAPSKIFEIIGDVTSIVLACVLLFILLYLFIILGEHLKNDIKAVIPEKSKESVFLMGKKTKDILFSLYVIHVALATLVFILAIPYAWILVLAGVIPDSSVMLIAVLCGVLALIPMIGAIFVLVFMALYCLSIGNIVGIILTATVGYFLLCVLIDFILRPKLTANRVKIRPMLVFLGFFGGGAAMGIIGFVLGPIFLVLGITAYDVFFKEMRKVKQQELEGLKSKDAYKKALEEKNR